MNQFPSLPHPFFFTRLFGSLVVDRTNMRGLRSRLVPPCRGWEMPAELGVERPDEHHFCGCSWHWVNTNSSLSRFRLHSGHLTGLRTQRSSP